MYYGNIEEVTEHNNLYRKVLYTGTNSQLVVMSLNKGEEIGEEIHEKTDQIIFFVEGKGEVIVGERILSITEDYVVFIPAGTKHNVRNLGEENLKFYTVYAPPEHPQGLIQSEKEDLMKGGE